MGGWYSDTVKRLRVGVLYGGRSGEHEVSLASAASVFAHLDRTRYEPVPIRIEKDGRWALADKPPAVMIAGEVIEQARVEAARPLREGREVHFVARPSDETILSIDRSRNRDAEVRPRSSPASPSTPSSDAARPVRRGRNDPGAARARQHPYVGAGVLASAVGMDKGVMKVLFARAAFPSAPTASSSARMERRQGQVAADLEKALKLSDVREAGQPGVERRHLQGEGRRRPARGDGARRELRPQDRRRGAVPNAREIECAVLGNDTPEASIAGEIIPSREFYDYESKVPGRGVEGRSSPRTCRRRRRPGEEAGDRRLQGVDGAGMSRVDFLLSRDTGKLFLNEVNTIPGLHDHQHVPEALGRVGCRVPGPARPPDRASCHRPPRRESSSSAPAPDLNRHGCWCARTR
jgi:D-alanine-D-alanine ligase